MNEMPGIEVTRGDDCVQCGHPFDPHVLVAYDEPVDGGLIFCPSCDCVSTWSVVGQGERPVMPPPHVVAEYREATFGK